MNFVYWFLNRPDLYFIIMLLMIVVVVDLVEGWLSVALLTLLFFPICFPICFPDYPKEILSEEHYIEFRVYQEEQKQKKEQEKIRQEQIELEIQKRLEEKGIKYEN